jgi:pimeloyl-ACP methyl ester carboxylesterase
MKILRKILVWLGSILGGLLLLAIVVPLIWPVPSLTGIQTIDQLKDSDSQFINLDGINVHYKQYGTGEPYIILLHGFGASTFTWREVIEPLSQYGTVIAYDHPGSGLTDRPWKMTWDGLDPYGVDGQVQMLLKLMDAKGIQKAILIGNSAGGAIATYAAWQYPDRVQALVEVDAAIYQQGNFIPFWLNWVLYTPEAERIGPLLMRSIQKWGVDFLHSAWYDQAKITDAVLAGYEKPLHAPDWDKGLFELLRAPRPASIIPHIREISIPSLVISGNSDKIVPIKFSIQLADELPNTSLVVIPQCGHLPMEEQPQLFLETVIPFIQQFTP